MGSETYKSFTVIPGRAGARFLLLCDHASNALPEGYGTLGLATSELQRHIAYDIGTAGVVRLMAQDLAAPAVLTCFSRLLVDVNRGEDDPTLIMRLSDGAVIPGNRNLTEAEREQRLARYWRPYHAAVECMIDECLEAGTVPALVAIHSFTPTWKKTPRPWHAAVLWDRDDRLARPLLEGLARDPHLIVGDNEPYTGRLTGDSMWRHGTSRGLPHAIVEIRQDLIATEAGQRAWAERLVTLLEEIAAKPVVAVRLALVEEWGSNTL